MKIDSNSNVDVLRISLTDVKIEESCGEIPSIIPDNPYQYSPNQFQL